MFSSVFVGFKFRPLVNFELVFISDARCRSKFIFWHMDIQLLQCCLLKRLPFLYQAAFVPWSKFSGPEMCRGLYGLSSPFCWSVCSPWCYYHTVGVVLPLCSFSKLFWCSRSCAFPYEFQNQFVNFYKMPAGILTDIILGVEINIESCDSWTWYTSPFI